MSRFVKIIYAMLGFALGFVVAVAITAPRALELHLESANKPQLEVAVGYARGTTAPDGTWWESQFSTDNTVNGGTWAIGVSKKISEHWGLRADFTQLPTFHTRNVAIPDEHHAQAYVAGNVSCTQGWQYCLAKWNGNGEAYGVHLGVFYDIEAFGLNFQPEIGLLPYHYRFDMTLEPLEPGAISGPVGDTGSGTFLTEYLRLTMLYGAIFLRVDYDDNIKGHAPVVGIQQGKLTAVLLGVAYPF